MKINISPYMGFCFGVDRAIKIIDKLPDSISRPIRMLGYLVHNEYVVDKLKKKGIEIVDSMENLKDGTLIISAHGIDPKIIRLAKKRGLNVINTTCPKVLKPHQLVKILEKQGYKIIIFGDKDHIEVQGIATEAGGEVIILNSYKEIKNFFWQSFKKIGIISQTTQNIEDFEKFVKYMKLKCKDVKVFNTICDSTRDRQEDIKKLALKNDAVIIIGSRTSANTKRLYEISKRFNPKSYFIQNKSDLRDNWLKNINSLGISAGASTPKWIIDETVNLIKSKSL